MTKGKWLLLLVALAVLCPSPVYAWGPITHLEIAHMQGYPDKWADVDYQYGSLLPDFSLACRMVDSSYPNLQSVTHTQEFVDALREVASEDFCNGWQAHLDADKVESLYSRERIAAGAPCGADWVVDQAYAEELNRAAPWMELRHQEWIDYALDTVGCEADCPYYVRLDMIYSGYIGGYQPNKAYYQEVLNEWYSDYQEYVDRAAFGEPPPTPPITPTPSTKKHRPWYSYEAPPERAASEKLKKEMWAELRAAMCATDDIAEKCRLYDEWTVFRNAHSVPSVRK